MTPEQIVKAHQYLYYVKCTPVLSDWDYDRFCDEHDIDGKGGSDLESSYTKEDKALAAELLKTHGQATT